MVCVIIMVNILQTPHFLTKSFWYIGKSLSSCYDCKNLSGWFIKINQKLTTSDVRMIKWLTGMTVIADFEECHYLSSDWKNI